MKIMGNYSSAYTEYSADLKVQEDLGTKLANSEGLQNSFRDCFVKSKPGISKNLKFGGNLKLYVDLLATWRGIRERIGLAVDKKTNFAEKTSFGDNVTTWYFENNKCVFEKTVYGPEDDISVELVDHENHSSLTYRPGEYD